MGHKLFMTIVTTCSDSAQSVFVLPLPVVTPLPLTQPHALHTIHTRNKVSFCHPALTVYGLYILGSKSSTVCTVIRDGVSGRWGERSEAGEGFGTLSYYSFEAQVTI